MSEPNIPKTQEEWLEHFKELGRKHGEILAQPFIDYFADKILLTKKEVDEAREECIEEVVICDNFLNYSAEACRGHGGFAYCRLCLKLTQFAKGGEDE